jgi:hypothetical protein
VSPFPSALREPISELLSSHPHVSHFEQSQQSEGWPRRYDCDFANVVSTGRTGSRYGPLSQRICGKDGYARTQWEQADPAEQKR